jgi:nucleotide-binding universal stress UspA family protein
MQASYERIVVAGVDGSPESLVAARYAVWQAGLRGLDVQLAYSYPVPLMDAPVSGSFFDDFTQAGRTILADAVAALEVPPGVAVSTLVAETLPALLMERLSQSAALAVVGQHAPAWYDRLAQGSVASPLVHRAGCPVVVVPPTWRQGQHDRRPVVVALDGEPTCVDALNFAFDEAELLGAQVVALHAYPGGTAAQAATAERNVAELLARARAGRAGTPARAVTVRGDVQHVILAAAQTAALLVVGLPHAQGLATWSRSTARRVMTRVECPMVVVPRHRRRPGVHGPAPAEVLVAS